MSLNKQDFERFMNDCRIKLTGASDAGIKQEFFNTCKEFLADSMSWVQHQHLDVIAGEQRYELSPTTGYGQIIRLIGVWDGNRIPVPAELPDFKTLHVHWQVQTTTVPPPPGAPPTRSATNPWLVVYNMNVVDPVDRNDVPQVPEFLLRVYSEHIKDGVLGRMMNEQNKSYSNQTIGQYHLRRFRTGIQIARTAADHGNIAGGQRWSFPRGWGSNTQRGGMVSAWPPETF